jgi:MFS family permease
MRKWLLLPTILCGTFMASFDYMVVNVAAPSFRTDLRAGPAALELIVGGYAFTYASGMVTGGRLGDLVGHKQAFITGMAGFTLASLLCGLAQTPAQLVGARMLQGLTAALMAPQVLALITAAFSAADRARALAWFGVVLGLGGVIGQVLGGVLLEANLFELGWRTIFLVNVPVGALAIIAAREVLPAGVRGAGRLDLVGAAGISAGLGLALAPLVLGQGYYLLLVAVPALAAALAWERRAKQPLLPLTLFRERAFSVGLLVNVAFMVSFGGLMFVLTLLLQTNLGLRPLAAGLTFLPLALASMATSLIGPRLVAKFGLAVLAAGAMTELLGLVSLAIELHGADLAVAWMLAPLTVIGAGSGLVLPALIGLVLQGVPPKQAGAAAGVLTTSQQFAAATGVAALGAVYFAKGNAELVAWLDAGLIAAMAALTALLREQSLELRDKLGSRHRQSEVPHAAESQV